MYQEEQPIWPTRSEPVNPSFDNVINCPYCGAYVGKQSDFMFMYIQPPGLKCKVCNRIALQSNGVTC